MQVKFKQSCNLYIESITTCTKDSSTACYNDILHLKFTVLLAYQHSSVEKKLNYTTNSHKLS